jgi:hypothetical protein
MSCGILYLYPEALISDLTATAQLSNYTKKYNNNSSHVFHHGIMALSGLPESL